MPWIVRARVSELRRNQNTLSGNPRWSVTLVTETGEKVEAFIQEDTLLGYVIDNEIYREQYHIYQIVVTGQVVGIALDPAHEGAGR